MSIEEEWKTIKRRIDALEDKAHKKFQSQKSGLLALHALPVIVIPEHGPVEVRYGESNQITGYINSKAGNMVEVK